MTTIIIDICARCDNDTKNGTSLCTDHLEENRLKRQEFYYDHKSKGLCIYCNMPALPNKTQCKKHNDNNNLNSSIIIQKRKDQGVCIRCCEELDNNISKIHCKKCHIYQLNCGKTYYDKQKKIRIQKKNKDMEGYVTIPQAAKELQISRQRVHKMCQDNKILGAIKSGNRWKIPTPIRSI